MNENLDLTKILEGCPYGTEFYHSCYGKVWFIGIDIELEYPIHIKLDSRFYEDARITSVGTLNKNYNGECVLFPSKDQRDWSKFERFWDKQKSKELNKETYFAKETTTVEKAADVFSEMLVELWPDLLGFGGIAKKLENEFRKRLEE